jgi:hypothetical protein
MERVRRRVKVRVLTASALVGLGSTRRAGFVQVLAALPIGELPGQLASAIRIRSSRSSAHTRTTPSGLAEASLEPSGLKLTPVAR